MITIKDFIEALEDQGEIITFQAHKIQKDGERSIAPDEKIAFILDDVSTGNKKRKVSKVGSCKCQPETTLNPEPPPWPYAATSFSPGSPCHIGLAHGHRASPKPPPAFGSDLASQASRDIEGAHVAKFPNCGCGMVGIRM